MPELPEVETMRRGIDVCVGSRICDVQRVRCRLKPIAILPRIDAFRRRAAGATIVGTGRAGKRAVVVLDTTDRIVFEPRMTGLLLLADPPDEEHLRLRIELDGGKFDRIMYWDRRGLGSVRLFSAAVFQETFGPDRLGPDALSISPAQLQKKLSRSRRAIKVALLDQQVVAGIGNLYASEILHDAGLHPETPCNELSMGLWRRLHAAISAVLQDAIRHEGSTLSDRTYRNALSQYGRYQNRHRVYDRQNQPCPDCGVAKITRIVQAQRSTFYCPKCQPRRTARKRT